MTKQTKEVTGGKADRKPSSSYAIQQLKAAIIKAEALKMATDEELQTLKKIHNNMVSRWVSQGLGF